MSEEHSVLLPQLLTFVMSDRRPYRILFATLESGWAGGAEAQMLELAAGLDRSEFEPLLLTTPYRGGQMVPRARDLGMTVDVLPYRFLRRLFPFVGYYTIGPLFVRALLHRRRIDLVHTHCQSSAVPIITASAGMRMPLAYHIHDLDRRWVTRRTLRVLNRKQTVAIPVSDVVADYARKAGVDPQRIRTVHNGIHIVDFPPDARARVRTSLGIGNDEIALVLLGRVEPRKGQEFLVRALAHEKLRGLPLRAFFIGATASGFEEHDRKLREMIVDLGLSDRVHFVGFREDAPQLLAGFDIATLPLRREAFGRVVVESMNGGLPIIGYAEAALPELVRQGREGYLVNPGDLEAFVDKVAMLARDAALRHRLGSNARERARAFSHHRFVAEMSEVYRELLSRRPSGAR